MKQVIKYLTILFSLSLSPLLGGMDDVKYLTITSSQPMYARACGMDPVAADAFAGKINSYKDITLQYTQYLDVITIYYNVEDFGLRVKEGEDRTIRLTHFMPKEMPEKTELYLEVNPTGNPHKPLDITCAQRPGNTPSILHNVQAFPSTVKECIRAEEFWCHTAWDKFQNGKIKYESGWNSNSRTIHVEPYYYYDEPVERSLSECLKLQQNSMYNPK